MEREGVWGFYARYAAEVARKHWKMGRLAWRFHRFQRALDRDEAAKGYSDVALTADAELGEVGFAGLETMLTQIAVAR